MTTSAEPSTPSGSSATQQRRRQITSYKNTTSSPATNRDRCRDRCGLSPPQEFLDSLKASHAEAVQARIEACDAAAPDLHSEVSARLVASAEFDSNSSDREPCKTLLASALHNAPPDRVWKAFESHHTKKNYCDFLVEFFNSEQAIIDRFESAKAECTVPDWLKSKHAKTLETRTNVCDAAAVDPDGLVSSYS